MNTIDTKPVTANAVAGKHPASQQDRTGIVSTEKNRVQTAPPKPSGNSPVDRIAVKETAAKKSEELQRSVRSIQKFLDSIGRELKFEINRDTGDVVIKVFRKSDGELIRRIPPDSVLEHAQSNRGIEGLLLEKKV